MRLVGTLVVGLMVLLQGCASPPTQLQMEKPEQALSAEKSLLVGGMVNRSLNGIHIDGRKYAITGGKHPQTIATFAIEVPPGKHTVTAVGHYVSNGYFRQYPLDRTVSTQPGEILNLGSVVITNADNGEFWSHWIGNHEDVARDLAVFAPDWLRSDMVNGRYANAAGPYAGPKVIDAIVAEQFSGGTTLTTQVPAHIPVHFHGSILGTIVAYIEQPEFDQAIDVIRTDVTTDRFEHCEGVSDRLVCVVRDTTLLDYLGRPVGGEYAYSLAFVDPDTGGVSRKPLPFGGEFPRYLVSFGESGIVLVTEDYTVYSTLDNGQSWNSLSTELERGFMQAHSRHGVAHEKDQERLRLFLDGSDTETVEVDMASGRMEVVD